VSRGPGDPRIVIRPGAASIDSGLVNPRYRRMVIPGALLALILLVVVTALVRG
jgi:hypothetical protein